MREELREIERIELYLEGKLTKAELVDFEDRIQNDKTFRDKVNAQKEIVSALQEHAFMNEVSEYHATLSRKRKVLKMALVIGVFTLIAIALVAFLFCSNNSEIEGVSFIEKEYSEVTSNRDTLSRKNKNLTNEALKTESRNVVLRKTDDSKVNKNDDSGITFLENEGIRGQEKEASKVDEKIESKSDIITENNSESFDSTASEKVQFFRPDNRQLYSLLRGALEVQKFKIRTNRDTFLKTNDGLIFNFKKDVFLTKEDVLEIEIMEFNSKSAMVLGNMQTVSGTSLIESRGMFDIRAFDKTGKEVNLTAKEKFKVLIPRSGSVLNGLWTFYGEKDPITTNTDWSIKDDNRTVVINDMKLVGEKFRRFLFFKQRNNVVLDYEKTKRKIVLNEELKDFFGEEINKKEISKIMSFDLTYFALTSNIL